MEYKNKYLKYKAKYLKLNKQIGGHLVYNPFINDGKYHLLKEHINKDNNNIIYENMYYYSSQMNEYEMRDLYIFIHFVIPYLQINIPEENKMIYLSKFGIDNTSIIGAGGFGVAFALRSDNINLLFKVCKLDSFFDAIVYEAKMNNKLFNIPSGIDIFPPQINKIYGYITTNHNFHSNVTNNVSTNNVLENNIISTIDKNIINVDVNNINNIIRRIDPSKTSSSILNNIVVFISELKDGNMREFKRNIFDKLLPVIKYKILVNFLQDMSIALSFLSIKKIIHKDIKLDNIVFKKNEEDMYLFSLIDFGLITEINEQNDIISRNSVDSIFSNEFYKTHIAINYDWYCLFIAFAEIIGFIKLEDIYNIYGFYYLDESNQKYYYFHDTNEESLITHLKQYIKKYIINNNDIILDALINVLHKMFKLSNISTLDNNLQVLQKNLLELNDSIMNLKIISEF